MIETEYLILGAGVSGLTFAGCINSENYIVIERENEAGGYCRSTYSGEYVWDYSGHFFHFTNPWVKGLFSDLFKDDSLVICNKKSFIYYNNELIDYPFQKNIHELPKDEMIDCLCGLFEREKKDDYDSFLEMLYGKFGTGITEKFLKPYNEKLYATNLELLDPDAMGRFFPDADEKEIILNMRKANNSSYNQTFSYPKRGASAFVQKLLCSIKGDSIKYGEKVTNINLNEKLIETDNELYKYTYLISTIPFIEFVSLSGMDNSIDLSAFSCNQVLVLNIGFDLPAVNKDIHWIYYPDKDIPFYRVGFYNNILGSQNLSIYVEIGYPMNYVITKSDIDSQLDKSIDNLRKIGIVTDHRIVDYQSLIMNPAYVHVTTKCNSIVEQVCNDLAEKDTFLIGRYGRWKYCSIEDCMLDAINTYNYINP